jgi:hypothetical protein
MGAGSQLRMGEIVEIVGCLSGTGIEESERPQIWH